MNPEIKFIYFDMGKVLVNFDHQLGSENVARITGIESAVIHEIIFDSGLQSDYESGKIDSNEFAQRFNQAARCQIDETTLLNAVSNIFSLNRAIVPLLTQLRSARFPIGILSNTCEAHWKFILRQSPLIGKLFEPQRCVLSFLVESMKPAPPIYEQAQLIANFPHENIFFCDDLQPNVDGARKASFQSVLFESPTQLLRDLIQLNVNINL